MISLSWFLIIAANLLLVASSPTQRQRRDNDAISYTCDHPECYVYVSKLAAAIDWSVNPCDDFFQFTCGRWQKKFYNQNHEGEVAVDSFLGYKQNDRIHDMLYYTNIAPEEEALQKAATAYQSCFDAFQNVQENFKAIRHQVKLLGGWHVGTSNEVTPDSLIMLMTHLFQTTDIKMPFFVSVQTDGRNSSNYHVSLSSPDEDSNDPEDQRLLTTIFGYLKAEDIALIATELFRRDKTAALADAKKLIQLEDNLKAMVDEDTDTMALKEFHPSDDYDFTDIMNKIFKNIKTFTGDELIDVDSVSYYEKFFNYIAEPENAKIVSDYMMLDFILTSLQLMGSSLPSPLRNIGAFGATVPSSTRMNTCLPFAKKYFDYVIAMKYGELYLDIPNDKKKLKEMTENLMKVFHERLETLDWLDEESRKQALYKLENIQGFYEYPDWVSDVQTINQYYEDVYASDSIVKNSVSSRKHRRQLDLRSLVVPYDSLKWDTSPLDVNAEYFPFQNYIYIFEGYSDFPYFNNHLLSLINYAAMGSVVGHELTHGFDNEGVQFDALGNNIPWLSKDSQANFQEKSQCLIDQYSSYYFTEKDLPEGPSPCQMDGDTTLGENIADSGGLILSYHAYKQWVKNHQPEILPEILAKNFTNDQAFFVVFSYIYCEKMLRDYEDTLSDSHSPNKFRVIGPLSNFDEFAKAFNCPANAPMVRGEEACHIW